MRRLFMSLLPAQPSKADSEQPPAGQPQELGAEQLELVSGGGPKGTWIDFVPVDSQAAAKPGSGSL